MSRKQLKSQASSARAASSALGGFGSSSTSAFGVSSSPLSYVSEPPDLSAISDPNVVVYFRNLSKKDSTTKAKALEDLQAYLSLLKEPVEEGVLEAWIKSFPRTSIDNSKSVRQNAHALQGQMSASAGKRVAKYMPKAIGAWLSGLYDSDRSVTTAVQSSLQQVFNTPEKLQNVRKVYQQPILEYCRDAINKETALTLSDERTVSPDDAEAKYSRVISACINLVGSLIANLDNKELSKFQSSYDHLLADKKIWTFATYGDASIRRSLHRFLKTSVQKQPDAVKVNLDPISKAYLATGLDSDQTGSAYDYVEALAKLTPAFPTVWTEHYKSKTSVQKRLRQFLRKGSQSGPREFWDRLLDVFEAVPRDILPQSGDDSATLLDALHGGISRREEPRLNLEAAFKTYLTVASSLCIGLPENEQQKLLEELVLPIIPQYLRPTAELSQWSLPPNAVGLVTQAMCVGAIPIILQERWQQYAQKLVEDMKTSAPEQSKDYERSQKALAQQAARFATVQARVLEHEAASVLRPIFREGSALVVTEALTVIKNRNGKPYGAASAIVELLDKNKPLVLSDSDAAERLAAFVKTDLPNLVLSPSATQLVELLYLCAEIPTFNDSWSSALTAILNAPESVAKSTALGAILTSHRVPATLDFASSDDALQKYITASVHAALEGRSEWDSFGRILQSSKIIAPATADDVLTTMTRSLSISDQTSTALEGFRQIVKQDPALLKSFVASDQGSQLLQHLLYAIESPNEEVSQEAAAVNASIQTLLATDITSQKSMYDVIHRGLLDISHTSVSVETLLDLARQILSSSKDVNDIGDLLPNKDEWEAALASFLNTPPRASLAITNPLGGAVYLVKGDASRSTTQKQSHDSDGYSSAFRIAQYITKLYKEFAESLPALSVDVVWNVAFSLQLADDNLGLAGANNFWIEYNAEVETDVMTFMEDAHQLITRELKRQWSGNHHDTPILNSLFELLTTKTQPRSAPAYYTARIYSILLSDATELRGLSSAHIEQFQSTIKELRRKKENFALLALLNALREPLAASKSCERMCNELVADLTGVDIVSKQEQALEQLVTLNTIVYGQDSIANSIAKQRLIFFTKHVVQWLSGDNSLAIRAEVCRALGILLPLMGDIYGEHWSDILTSLADSWNKTTELKENESGMDSPIPFVHASLKLYSQLRALTQVDDPNDDLLDAWKESERSVAQGLINLLKHSQNFPDEFHQPLKIVNEVLARQIAKVPMKHLESTEELFPLLYVESQPVQQTAFDILHKQIPAAQEQISIDSALEKTTARLPEELLSLILEAPTTAALAGANFERSVPLPLRGYLLSWLLIFDHLEHASFKVKNDYIDHIKQGDYLPGLLDFTFSFLGHSSNKPTDVSKLDITSYTPDIEPPLRDAQWLLTHLYFLCLRHLPSLTKAWWIDCKSRPIVVTLESWTEKYISPPVITAALQGVSEWATAQDDAEPDSPFSIKVNPRAREITASYTVDEQTMAMRISLPTSFPISNAHIEGINRVAVNEQKWQSWMRTSLGAITLFNGSLIDALTTFKRNVEGALKGQTECAICYSIVGSDRKIPDKRCSTCKNLFHGACLFKWFKTSGASACPLCRQPFNYG